MRRKEKGGRDTFNLQGFSLFFFVFFFFLFFDVVYSTEPTDGITGAI